MSKPRKLVIAKLGGSCLTDKKQFECLKAEVLQNITNQVKTVLDTDPDGIYIVLVHGAGSFGHFQAREFAIKQGGRNDSWLEGFVATRLSVTKLNHHVVSSCVSSKLPAVGISPFPHIHSAPGASCEMEPDSAAVAGAAAEALRWGLLPVLHGDAVLSAAPHRCTILSGDTLLLWLARHLPMELGVSEVQCVFLTDVPGVYSRFDAHAGKSLKAADIIERIIVQPDGHLLFPEGISTAGAADDRKADVTGGMRGKLEAAAAVALLGIPVYVTQAGSASSLQALSGQPPDVGTLISIDNNFSLL
jgi:isopentenyl phosphate kinase